MCNYGWFGARVDFDYLFGAQRCRSLNGALGRLDFETKGLQMHSCARYLSRSFNASFIQLKEQ